MGDVLALDLGSSSVRALVLHRDGAPHPVGAARRPVNVLVDSGGRAEVDPDRYVGSVVACIDELCAAGVLEHVVDVAVSSQWHSMVPVDGRGRPLAPVLTWADGRGEPAVLPADQLAAVHERTGAWPHPQYWTAKAPWLLAHVPSVDRLLGISELLSLRLLGDASMSTSLASGTGLYDWSAQRWDEEALELAGIRPSLLPPLQEKGWHGKLLPMWQRRWEPLAHATWHPAVGDGAAANVGAGCVDASMINVTIGTTTAVRVVELAGQAAPLSPGLWRFRVDDDRVVSGVSWSSGGGSYAWLRGLTSLPSSSEDVPGLSEVAAGSDGVTVLPFYATTRAPRHVPAGNGAIAGLSLATTPLHLVSATMEAVCFEVAEGISAIEAVTAQESQVVACGGALEASRTWQSRLASVLDRAVHVVRVPEASARGAALISVGGAGSARGSEVDVVVPRRHDVERLAVARERFLALRRAFGIAPVFPPEV